MVSKKELEDLRNLHKQLMQIRETGKIASPLVIKILEDKGLIKAQYKNKKKKGWQTGSPTIRVLVKFILTEKGLRSYKVLSALL